MSEADADNRIVYANADLSLTVCHRVCLRFRV